MNWTHGGQETPFEDLFRSGLGGTCTGERVDNVRYGDIGEGGVDGIDLVWSVSPIEDRVGMACTHHRPGHASDFVRAGWCACACFVSAESKAGCQLDYRVTSPVSRRGGAVVTRDTHST